MIELGKYQTLEVVKKTSFGLYLSEDGAGQSTRSDLEQDARSGFGQNARTDPSHRILLPIREAPADAAIGDRLEVFLYRDSEDREIATTAKVPVTIGGLAVLKVKEVGKVGAFLDWGLRKDLLLPYKEQTRKVEEGDQVLVTLYLDKSRRLCATMKVYHLLSCESPYKKDDTVTGIVYDAIDAFGVFVAVDNRYSAMLPKNELFSPVRIGDIIQARVADVREDGKLTLSRREKSYMQMDADAVQIINKLKAGGGFLPYGDSSDPDRIKEEFHLSKNAFKRAIGRLYKAGAITITEDGIRLL